MNKIMPMLILVAITFVSAITIYAREVDEVDNLSTEKNEVQIQEDERKRAREKEDKKMMEYAKAIKANPDSADAHYNLAMIYDKRGRFNDAITEYQKTINLKPELIDARFKLAHIFAEKKMFGYGIQN